MMTMLRQQAMQLVQQLPEEQVPNIIEYILSLAEKMTLDRPHESKNSVSPKLNAFSELEKMIKPVPEFDYKKELDDARNEKYGHLD